AGPALTVIAGLLLAESVPEGSLAVMVREPAVLKVKLENVRVPETSVRLPAVPPPFSSAIAALASVLVIVTLGVALLTTFQLASTALTLMPLGMAVPAVWAVGVPVLPVAVPGAALSPGSRSCSLVTAPALTASKGLALPGMAG